MMIDNLLLANRFRYLEVFYCTIVNDNLPQCVCCFLHEWTISVKDCSKNYYYFL